MYDSSLKPTNSVLPTRRVGARRLPVGPSIASTASFGALPAVLNSLTFFPLATISFDDSLASAAASERPSLRLAGTISFGSIPLASRNLDARVQDVQPLRV